MKTVATSVPASAAVSGTQSIQRAVAVLLNIASAGPSGQRLTDISVTLAIELATAHRIVKGLCFEGLVARDNSTRRYKLGRTVYELGLAAASEYPLKEACRESLERLADKTGDSVFLLVRSGFDVVCLDRVEGNFPIQTHTLDVGARRPLGIGAGGLAVLMALPAEEIEQTLAANARRYPRWGRMSVARLREVLATSRSAGYAINDGDLMPGVSAIGLAFTAPFQRGAAAQSQASISIASVTARVEGERRAELSKSLVKEVRALERALQARFAAAHSRASERR